MVQLQHNHGPRAKGRAAGSNRTNRFERFEKIAEDDGWDAPWDPGILRTETRIEAPRKIITKNSSPDLSFDRSINPYRGCEHGCIYCFARPSHAYLGLSPGLDFETQLLARPTAPQLLRKELSARRYTPRVIAIGTNTDAYQPIEREHRIMRGILEVLREFRHPVGIATKGALVTRDADILGEMGQAGLARVGITITTLDPEVSRRMEPRVPGPAQRLRMIEALSQAGCPVRVMISPVIPGLTDHEIEAIMAAAKDAGAVAVSAITLRLPREVSVLFQEWLAEHYPNRAEGVMRKVRAMHGGKDYDATWGQRLVGQGIEAALIQKRVAVARKKLELAARLPDLRCDLFKVPQSGPEQLSLF